MAQCHERLEKYLDATLPAAATHPAHLHEAMRYAVLGEGKVGHAPERGEAGSQTEGWGGAIYLARERASG